MRNKLALVFSVLVFTSVVLLTGPAAWGQAATSLRGAVSDPSGAAIPNATIRLVNTGTNTVRTSTTDAEGNYVFLQISPGDYRLEIASQGFSKYQQTGIQLLVNLPATINVKLRLGSQQQTVTVTEQAPIVNATDASEGNTMGQTQLEQLPIEARDIVQLLSLQPGVVYTTDRPDAPGYDTRSGAVNGERSDQSNVSLDGVDDNEQSSGEAFKSVLPVPLESVQEFRVSTSNYGIDQGRSAGGQVGLVTKGGSNSFHGALYEFNRSGIGEANDWFIKSAEATTDSPNTPPHLVRNVFGAAIGGPIKKDRLFFFLNYEGQRRAQGDSVVREVPTATLRDGIIMYPCGGSSSSSGSGCPGGTVQGMDGAPFPVPAGDYALGYTSSSSGGLQSQIAGMDPLGIGPSSVALQYYNSYPLPNDTSVGDNLNFSGFRFASPVFERDEWLVGRIDYQLTANGKHTLFWRGSGRDDNIPGDKFLPSSTAPENSLIDRSKGFVVGYTALLRSNLVNNFHYGLTRQSINDIGSGSQPWIYIRNLDQGVYYGNSFTLPTHNFVDDLSWTKGNHALTFGTDIRIIRNVSNNYGTSYSYGTANASWIDTAGFANTSSPFSPDNNGYPAVASGFDNSYDFPLMGMLGMVTEVNAQYNYHLESNGTGTALGQGAPVVRHFASDEYDLYIGDSWKFRPNITFNYGLRYELMSPVWETQGQEVAPTLSLAKWFDERDANMKQGIPDNSLPLLEFGTAGPSYGKPGYYNWQKKNFAPRVSFAWSMEPSAGWLQKIFGEGGKSVLRGGFGMYNDHFGQELTNSFDQNGAFGLATDLSNPAGIETASTAPRVESISGQGFVPNFNTIPTVDIAGNQIYESAPPAQFPETPPSTLDTGGFCICWGVDNSLKTPYSYAIDLSYQRQIGAHSSLEVAYVGHLGRRLLVQEDVAEPLNLTDTKSGVTYFQAVKALAKLYNSSSPPSSSTVTDSMVGSTAAYWNDMIKTGGSSSSSSGSFVFPCSSGSTASATQAAYDLFSCFAYNETTALFLLDIPQSDSGLNFGPVTGPYSYYSAQYSSLYAWRTLANSNYNAMQVTFKHQMAQGLQFDFNYTYSKSIDLASDAERIGPWGGFGTGQIINAWNPNQLRAVSDFDLRHQINANWVWQLPVGRGHRMLGEAGRGLDALVGGWQLSGLARWSSGFPVNVSNGYYWPTDWQLGGAADLTGSPISQGRTLTNSSTELPCTSFAPGCVYNMFTNQQNGLAGFVHNEVGESGVRNALGGDGYAGVDLGLSKRWIMPYNDLHSLEFSWNVFNIANQIRFDGQSALPEIDQSSSFGNYNHLFTNPRVMQFGLRYAF